MWIGYILAAAFVLDALLGDPAYRLHPVRITGRLISAIEGQIRNMGSPTVAGGIVLMLLTLGAILAIYMAGRHMLGWAGVEWLWDIYWVYSSIAFRDMFDHVEPLKTALEHGRLDEARQRAALIVGRRTDSLGMEELARAAVESIAEGFVDGILTPIVWFAIGGALGYLFEGEATLWAVTLMVAARVINTLDSMVGYRDKRYILLGRASARADDVLNFLPARLSIAVLFVASTLIGYNGLRGLKVAIRDRLKHPSPNAAHPESFIAGTLNIRLGGPSTYSDGIHHKPLIGGSSMPQPRHIEDAKKIIMLAGTLSVVVVVMLFAGLY